jgi:hypothetical protein
MDDLPYISCFRFPKLPQVCAGHVKIWYRYDTSNVHRARGRSVVSYSPLKMVKMGIVQCISSTTPPRTTSLLLSIKSLGKKPHVVLTQGATRWDVRKCGEEMSDSTSVDGLLLRAIEKKAERRWSMETGERDVRHKHRQSHSRCCKPWFRRQGGDAQT